MARHPKLAQAEQFKQQHSEFYGGAGSQPTSPPNVPPAVEPKPETQPKAEQEATLTPPQEMKFPEGYQNLFAPQPQPETQQVAQDTAALEEARRDNAALQEEIKALKSQLEAAQKVPDEVQAAKDEAELEALLNQYSSELVSIDPGDAKKLLAPVLKSMREQNRKALQAAESRIQELNDTVQKKFGAVEEEKKTALLRHTQEAILKAHPDLEQMQKTEAYKQIMLTPVGGNSGILTGQLVAAEFQRGNADYIIQVLNQVRQAAGSALANVASISPSSGVSGPVRPQTGGNDLSVSDIAEAVKKVQRGEMTRDELREIMKKHRAASRSKP